MDEPQTGGMGTTATPDKAGAAAIDEQGTANGSARGVETTLGGERVDPLLPFDRRPESDDPVDRGAR